MIKQIKKYENKKQKEGGLNANCVGERTEGMELQIRL